MSSTIFDKRICELGEGALWHPIRKQFFWFDILGRRLLSRQGEQEFEWRFDRMASAAGWINEDELLVATETGLAVFELKTGALTMHHEVEAEDLRTRSNDGRADRQGGFWFSTMGKSAEPNLGSIYRYYKGEVRKLFDQLTIPNAICFSLDGQLAYFADTSLKVIWSQPLDKQGWPVGQRQIFVELGEQGLNPDGALIDAHGGLWCAKWGEGAVMRYNAQGERTHEVFVGGIHASCPAFGGEDMSDMLVTTALEGLDKPDAAQGVTYLLRSGFTGVAEPKVLL